MKLFIFGSTGDLVKRKVMRALQELDKPELEIYAIGRRELDKEAYRNFICSDWCRPEFRKNLHYLKIEFDKFDFNEFRGNMDKKEINYFYISLPPFMQKKAFLILDSISREGYKIQILSVLFGKIIYRFIQNIFVKIHLFNNFSRLILRSFFPWCSLQQGRPEPGRDSFATL